MTDQAESIIAQAFATERINYLEAALSEAMKQAESSLRSRAAEIVELRDALEQSVKLQSHYAFLLNATDGGERMQFGNAQEWMDRLASLGALARGEGDGSAT